MMCLKSGSSGDLIDKAKTRITEIQVTLDAEADEDRKKKEEERKRHLRRNILKAYELKACRVYTCLTRIKTISHVIYVI